MKSLRMILAMVLIVGWAGMSWAIPTLGVAPSHDSYGVYNGPSADYLDYFTDEYVAYGGDAGFIMTASGNDLTVWFGADNGTVATDINIYLATDSSGIDFLFDNMGFSELHDSSNNDGDQANGYKPLPYSGVNLGTINGPSSGNSSWVKVFDTTDTDTTNDLWAGTWYMYTGVIEYTGFEPGDWMFAFADYTGNGVYDNGQDDFSPHTTSSTYHPVPEPATMFLFGLGLIGLAGFGRKKFKK